MYVGGVSRASSHVYDSTSSSDCRLSPMRLAKEVIAGRRSSPVHFAPLLKVTSKAMKASTVYVLRGELGRDSERRKAKVNDKATREKRIYRESELM